MYCCGICSQAREDCCVVNVQLTLHTANYFFPPSVCKYLLLNSTYLVLRLLKNSPAVLESTVLAVFCGHIRLFFKQAGLFGSAPLSSQPVLTKSLSISKLR